MPNLKFIVRDLALACALALSLSACGGGGSGESNSPVPGPDPVPSPAPVSFTKLTGHVADAQSGEALAGVLVKVGTLQATSDASGNYAIDAVVPAEGAVVQFSKPLYAANFATVDLSFGKTSIANRRLAKIAVTQTLNAQTGGAVTLAGSAAQVQLPAAGMVDVASGAAYTGTVSVEMTPIDPGVDPLNMPGNYRAQGEAVPIESMGALQVELRDAAGKQLNLAPGKQATIRIPVPTGAKSPPLTMPLYYFKESTGLWVREGAATLAGSAPNQYYEGQVTHFTVWNADQPLETIYINGCVIDAAGMPAEASVKSSGLDYYGASTVATSMPSGQFRVPARRNSRVAVNAENGRAMDTVETLTGSGDLTLPACLKLGNKLPTILTQPSNLTITPGSFDMLAVSAASASTYQWYRNGVALPDKARTLLIFGTAASDGDYYVVVSNLNGSVTSATVKVTVGAPMIAPSILGQPQDVSVLDGANASFTVSAQGDALSYQWLRNGVDISGATGPTLALGAVTLAQSGALYTSRVSNTAGSVLSAAARLTVVAQAVAPSISAQPANQSVSVGQSASFSVQASGTAPFTYQWLRNGVAIANATGATYQSAIATLADSGTTYSVQVSNTKGTVLSNPASLAVSQSSSSVPGLHLWFAQGTMASDGESYGALPIGGGKSVAILQGGELANLLVQGTLASGLVSNAHTRSLIFWRNGRLFRQDLIGAAGLPAAAMVSSLSSTGLCGIDGMRGNSSAAATGGDDLVDASLSWQIFSKAGADGNCATADDTFVAVRANMSPTDAPISVLRPLSAVHGANGAVTGWLQRDGQKIVRSNVDFASPVTLFTLPAGDLRVSSDGENIVSGSWVFESGGKVYAVDPTGGAQTPTVLATLAGVETVTDVLQPGSGETIVALSSYGFTGSTRFVRYTSSTKAVATLGTLPMAGSTAQLTATRIIMHDLYGKVVSLPISGGTVQAVYTPAGPAVTLRTHIAGERIWLESAGNVVSVNSDGSGLQTISGARLAGCLYSANAAIFNDEPCDAMVVIVGAEARAYDGVGGALRFAYGSVPLAPANMTSMFTVSPFASWGQGAVLTQIVIDSAAAQTTAFTYYFQSDQPGIAPVAPP